jgi:hypothetical protein
LTSRLISQVNTRVKDILELIKTMSGEPVPMIKINATPTIDSTTNTPNTSEDSITTEAPYVSWSESLWNIFSGTSGIANVPDSGETSSEEGDIFVVFRDGCPHGWFATRTMAKLFQTQTIKNIISETDEDFELCKITIDNSNQDNIKVYVRDITIFTLFPFLYSTVSLYKVPKGNLTIDTSPDSTPSDTNSE